MLQKLKDKNILIILICVTFLLSTLFSLSMIVGHDTIFHMFRVAGIAKSLSHGNIFAKIHYNSINGFGYGAGIFYPQLNLFLPSLLYLITNNINISFKVYIYFNILLAGIFMYFYLTNISKNKKTALIGSLLYIFAPYVYIQSFFRGAYGEMVGFVSLPLIFWGLELISKNNKYGNVLLILGAVYVLQSHVISALYIAIFTLLYLILNHAKFMKKKQLKNIGLSLIVIVLLSLYFLIPFLEHYINGGYSMMEKHFNPTKDIVFLSQLLFSSGAIGFVKKGADFTNELPFTIGLLIVSILILLPYVYSKINNKKEVNSFLLLGIITIFMMCCPFIWGHVQILDIIQAPYRLLMFCVFFLVVVDVIILDNLTINNHNLLLLGVVVLSFMQINSYVISTPLKFPPYSIYDKITDRTLDLNNFINGKEKTTIDTMDQSIGSGNDYLPVICDTDYIANRSNEIISLEDNDINVENYYNESGHLTATVNASDNSKVELPLIYYLGYKIKNNNNVIKYEIDENGFISINLENGINTLDISYTGTTLDKIGNTISIFSFLVFILYILNLKYNFYVLKKDIIRKK